MAKKMTDYRLDQMFDLYVKVTKNVNVYRGSEISKTNKTVAWTYKAGDVVGMLYSWVTDSNTGRIYMQFLQNGDLAKSYYIELEPRMINFDYFEKQLTAQKRASMSWYEGIWSDFGDSVDQYWTDIKDAAQSGFNTGLWIGGVVLIGIPLMKYYLMQKSVESIVKTAAREFKR
jgi:hypothetical protein